MIDQPGGANEAAAAFIARNGGDKGNPQRQGFVPLGGTPEANNRFPGFSHLSSGDNPTPGQRPIEPRPGPRTPPPRLPDRRRSDSPLTGAMPMDQAPEEPHTPNVPSIFDGTFRPADLGIGPAIASPTFMDDEHAILSPRGEELERADRMEATIDPVAQRVSSVNRLALVPLTDTKVSLTLGMEIQTEYTANHGERPNCGIQIVAEEGRYIARGFNDVEITGERAITAGQDPSLSFESDLVFPSNLLVVDGRHCTLSLVQIEGRDHLLVESLSGKGTWVTAQIERDRTIRNRRGEQQQALPHAPSDKDTPGNEVELWVNDSHP